MRDAFCNAFYLILILCGLTAFSNYAFASAPASEQAMKRYSAMITNHALANDIPIDLALAVVKHESRYDADATGQAGEIGLMQIKLATARGMGYRGSATKLYDPATNVRWGMKYLGKARQLAGGSECGTLSKYNGGHGTKRMIRSYCSKVRLAKQLSG
jgi:soluble lytic murein transglycosylase-like protein